MDNELRLDVGWVDDYIPDHSAFFWFLSQTPDCSQCPDKKSMTFISRSSRLHLCFLRFCLILFYVHWCFACMYVVWGCQKPWNWSYREVWAAMWIPGCGFLPAYLLLPPSYLTSCLSIETSRPLWQAPLYDLPRGFICTSQISPQQVLWKNSQRS